MSHGHYILGQVHCFFYIFCDESTVPHIRVCIKVFCDMNVAVFVNNEEIDRVKLSWILGSEGVLRRWSQLQNMLSHYKNADEQLAAIGNCKELESGISAICDKLDKIVEKASENSDINVNIRHFVFCIEQLRLACVVATRRRYSSDLLRVAFLLFTRSSVAYRVLLESGTLIMPHVSTLRRISSIFTVNAGIEDNEQVNYLKLRARDLDERNRFVCLQMDEIHVNPTMTFKGGSVSGQAQNSSVQAHSIQAFMISGVFGRTTEIVSLHPVKNITAEDLNGMLKKAISAVQLSGFVVIAVIADNNQVNCKAYEILSGTGKLEHSIANPQQPDKRIFLLFDTVHILKCVRNNWLNQTDPDQTFSYPPIPTCLLKIAGCLTKNPDEIRNDAPSSPAVESGKRTCGQSDLTIHEKLDGPSSLNVVSCSPLVANQPVNSVNCSRIRQDLSTSMPFPAGNPFVPPVNLLPAAIPLMSCMPFTPFILLPINNTLSLVPVVNMQTLPLNKPAITTAPVKHAAAVSCLKTLYRTESSSIVKTAHKLSFKTLYPTNLERQKVSLVLNLFNEFNVAALELQGQDDEKCKQTASFIRLITAWWHIVNVKQSFKGLHKRDSLSLPISDCSDERLQFLVSFADWLHEWGTCDNGCLTRQTSRALHHTTLTLVQLTKYALTTLSVKYILLGKLQTDNLERRFGEYRQLSGGNYNVSVQQILESEKKLRVSSFLSLHSSKLGHVAITDIREALTQNEQSIDDDDDDDDEETVDEFVDIPIDVKYSNFPCDEKALTYITGFVLHKFMLRDACLACASKFVQNKSLELSDDSQAFCSYISSLDRGGLKYPTELSVMYAYKVYSVVQILVSEQYETKFLQCRNHKSVATELVMQSICLDDAFAGDTEACSVCDGFATTLLHKMLPYFVNVFLNNYVKKRNDQLTATGGKKGKRKLQTLK